jgi:adenylate cyclase
MAEENATITRIAEPTAPLTPMGTWPPAVRKFIVRHLELLFILLMALIVVAVFYLLPYKIAFLNLFFLPVLTAAYYLGKRTAVMGAVLCLLSGVLFAYYKPQWFTVTGTHLNAFLVLGTWGGFLILTSAGIGSLQESLDRGFQDTRRLYAELKRSRVSEDMKVKVEKTLYATMDPVIAKLATEGKLRFEKRDISILFAELADFTSSSAERRADVVMDDLNHFLGHIEDIVELFHGHIDKYMGDGAMVEFGAPVDFDRHALLAVTAAVKMQQTVRKLDRPWQLREGIASGNAIVGMLGVRRQAYSALGDRVNIAKRLQEICEPGKIYLDEPTYHAVEPLVVARRVRLREPGRPSNPEHLERLNVLEDNLRRQGESAELLFELGNLNLKIHDEAAAVRHFGRALALDPRSTEIKLAYADACFKRGEVDRIQLKGKQNKIPVYEVEGIKDRWKDPAVIPPDVAAKYGGAAGLVDLPHDLVLSVEALDGSVGHSRVVSLLSYAIADRLKLNDAVKKTILTAGYLQGVGKEAVPHRILNSTGSLTDQEAKVLETYVQSSVAECQRLGYDDPRLLEIVLHHQEAWDGSGYPGRLRGEAIPLGARITSVAQVFSALTSWRPYHEAWDARAALTEIHKDGLKGRYDPKVVEALNETLGYTP